MKRLIEKTVLSALVMACRLATWPTRVSPSFVNATTEGVRRLPSWLEMTVGSPPSTTATTEFVVPRSIPITFAMSSLSCLEVSRQRRARRGSEPRRLPAALLHVDLDLLGLYRLHLRQRHGEHTVAVRRPNLVRLYGDGDLEDSLHAPGPSLGAEVLLGLHGLGLCALALKAQQVAG